MLASEYQLEPLSLHDYPEIIAFWRTTPGVGLSTADSREGIARYLARNPESSFQLRSGGRIVGTILGGHDGRRGFLHHLAVAAEHRKRGLARRLVVAALTALRREGIEKCHLMVFANNLEGQAFWRHLGWSLREDLRFVSCDLVDPASGAALHG